MADLEKMTYDEMVAHARDALEKQYAAEEKAKPVTKARDALALAQAAYRRANDIGIGGTPPSQSTIDAAAAEEAQYAPKAPVIDASMPVPGAPQPVPGSPLADARDITGDVAPQDPGSTDLAEQLRVAQSGPTSDAVQAAQKQFDLAGQGVQADQAGIRASMADAQNATEQSNQAAQTSLNASIAENAEQAPVNQMRTTEQQTYELAVKQAYQASLQATNQQMARIRQSSDEAATTQIKDFWADKSTVGKIIGIISQAFAGAANGLSGQPGAPTPLDRIIDRDLDRQKINLNNKVSTSYREQGILGLMERQYESSQAALVAAHLATIGHVDALAKEIAQKYNTPKAIAEYQNFHAQNLQKYSEVEGKGRQILLNSHLQQQNIASGILERATSANAALLASQGKKAGAIENHVIGIKEPVNIQQYHHLAPFADSIATAVNANEQILELLKKPDLTSANWRQQLENYASDVFAARRIDQRTGAKLEGKEAERVEVAVASVKKYLAGTLTPDKLYNFQQEVQNNINHDVGLYAKRVQAVTGFNPNLQDPQLGRHFRHIATAGSPNG